MAIFGQNPADITGAVWKSKNFSDVPDKAAARNNLDVPSKADVLYNSVPIGAIMPYWGSIAPAGYLPCYGQGINSGSFPDLVQFLNPGNSTASLPDLRGEFLRGWDSSRGVDPGRANLSSQNGSAIRSTASGSTGGTGLPANIWSNNEFDSIVNVSTYTVAQTTSTVTAMQYGFARPRNIAVLYCIKAYNSIANYTSSINMAGLVSDYSSLVSSTTRSSEFTGANQNLSANGWQKLPGGMVLQWGTATIPASNTTITFPTAFPTACASFSGTALNATIYVDSLEITNAPTTTNVQVAMVSSGASGASAVIAGTFKWIAIGY